MPWIFKEKLTFVFAVNETISTFVGCTFENDTCGWEDVSVGQGQWERGRNATGNTGPSLDHTLGTALGEAMHPNRPIILRLTLSNDLNEEKRF